MIITPFLFLFLLKQALMKAPSFNSAPDFKATIPIPSFSSAPDFTTNKDKDDRKTRRERSPSYKSSRRERSRSPTHKRRSRSPNRRKRSRSPSSRYERSSRRSRSPRHRRHRSRERSSRHERSSRSKRTPSPEIVHTGTLSTGVTFVMDRRGDKDNLKYGGNHSYDVPIYKRSGGGRVLGLPSNQRIDKSVVKSGTVTITDGGSGRKTQRYTDSNYAWKELDTSLKRIRIKPKKNSTDTDPFATHSGFIQFDDTTSKAQANDAESFITSNVDYRSLEGNKVKKIDHEEYEESEEEGESFNDQIRQRTIEFNRRLDKEPRNPQLWLDFVRFQDEAAAGLDPTSSKANKTSLNEVKLSIFEKALENIPYDQDLILAYLNCGAETWETLKLLREWDKMLKQNPDSIKLWSEYINLRQTNFASFSFTQCVQVFEDALATLGRHATRHPDEETRENIESLMVYILLRACLFMKQCGYQERAFAVIQASVEFNLYQPQLFNMTSSKYEDKLNAFADFWDNEVLRFGEAGALGWQEYYRASNNGEDIPEPVFEKKVHDEQDEMMTLHDWYNVEKTSENNDRLPLRMSQVDDDNVDEDPYRITLSDDIKPFLFNITTTGARYSLIYSILVFLGLPYTPPDVGTNTHFFTDTFTHNDLALDHFWPAKESSMKHLVWYVSGVPMNPEQTIEITNPYYIPNSFPVGLSEMFAKSGSWFKSSGKEFIHNKPDEEFTRNAFEQLLSIEKSEHLRICYLSFESSCGYKLGRRLAKSWLKDQRTSLTLWNAFAQLEKSHDRIDEVIMIIHARKVYLTALAVCHTFPECDRMALPLLYFMFAKLEMENNRPNEALKILASMSDNKPYNENAPPPTTLSILKTREYFSQQLAQLSTLSESDTERKAAFYSVGCAGLFEYLSSGLESACLIYEHALDYIKARQAERGYESEIIWIEYAALLYRHSTNRDVGGYRPTILRNAMERALILFPNNTIFLSFYIWNESKTKIHNRVHQLLNRTLKQDSNVILWLSAIYSELHRYKPFQVNSVRDFFERAVSDTRTKSSIILWKCYIQFETQQGNTERAYNLFYRSIRECPWSKELYLIGIQAFEKTMKQSEKNELVSLMMEKEIRLRNPIEDDLLA
ncbi:hypothetical protein INT47_008890 [Mucor saturninus]|uniref:Uncharacterized protein n=1 Tax=Mucor saturninus TaxID=64648 RepID=A0A8H7V5S7_9FUNG|nr:hypothetical protein INT47_008890 [Mucor saturninus]